MRRRRIKIISLAVTILAAILAFIALWDREPSYQGRTLREWIILHELASGRESVHGSEYNPTALNNSQLAILEIGTNALPCLIRWLQQEPGDRQWRSQVWDALEKVSPKAANSDLADSLLSDPYSPAQVAWYGFLVLGTNASGAVPNLLHIAEKHEKPSASAAAIRALGLLGPEGVSQVVRILSNTNHPNRISAVIALHDHSSLTTNSPLAARMLAQCMSGTNDELSIAAAETLGRLAIEPEITVAALTNGLTHQNAEVRRVSIRSLAWIKEQARPAVPALMPPLNDPSWEVRGYASNILQRLAPSVLQNTNEKPAN